jgi:hypothetical protein
MSNFSIDHRGGARVLILSVYVSLLHMILQTKFDKNLSKNGTHQEEIKKKFNSECIMTRIDKD